MKLDFISSVGVSLQIDTNIYQGQLSACGATLKWNDGDSWVRDVSFERIQDDLRREVKNRKLCHRVDASRDGPVGFAAARRA